MKREVDRDGRPGRFLLAGSVSGRRVRGRPDHHHDASPDHKHHESFDHHDFDDCLLRIPRRLVRFT